MTIFRYQVVLLGRVPPVASRIRDKIEQVATELGLSPGSLRIIDEADVHARERKAPLVAVFFGYSGATDAAHPSVAEIHADSLPIIPAVATLFGFSSQVPATIAGVNGLCLTSEGELSRLVSAIFENLHLLRSERRLFISYRRSESTGVAIQVFEALDERGFDPFLDTRSIPPAVDVQAELWHRLADCDIVILLDTPQFRTSHWTIQELTQANATSIQILHVLWPGVSPDATSAFSEFFELAPADFLPDGKAAISSRLTDECLTNVCAAVESLRARALAARYAYLVDYFCDLATLHGLSPHVQTERYVSVEITGKFHAIFPAVGVPTSPRLESFESAVKDINPEPIVRVLYDERGILDRWKVHLGWLSAHLPVKVVQIATLPDAFAKGEI